MKEKGVFVTGTDTGVGKTFVAALLLRHLAADGLDAVPMKPVQTGCRARGAQRVAPDLALLLTACGFNVRRREANLMCPYRFLPACSPHLAARRAGAAVSIPKLVSCFRALSRRHDFVVAEGAGGVLAPIGAGKFMADIAAAFGLPALVVARPGLGTLNHTLLTVRQLRDSGVRVLGVVLNDARRRRWGLLERDNAAAIERWGGTPVFGRIRFVPRSDTRRDIGRAAVLNRKTVRAALAALGVAP